MKLFRKILLLTASALMTAFTSFGQSTECQQFTISFDADLCSKLPLWNAADNVYYLDLCPNQTPTIAVKCSFPNNNTHGYTQTVSTTDIKWYVGSNQTGGNGATTFSYQFGEAEGYEMTVSATDVAGCTSQPLIVRVRTSQDPIENVSLIPQMCVNDIYIPTAGLSDDNTVVLHNVENQRVTSLTVSDTVYLPDGISCPPYGTYYRSNVTFTDFAPGASITSANDILYVRIKMEHSAIEDLKIKIFCPNGNSSTILPHPNYDNNSGFGESYFRVNFGSARRPDWGVTCNAELNPIGEPWNYVWSNNSTLGYQYAPGGGSCFNSLNFHANYNPHWDDSNYFDFFDTNHSYSVDSTNVANMTTVYHPYQSFSNLIGCPLNGTWFIEVTDNFPEDNGYIVEWELALDPSLLPVDWSYQVGVDTFYFEKNAVVQEVIQPTQPGNNFYTFHITDDFGCSFSRNIIVMAHQIPVVDLGEDITVCEGETVVLNPGTVNNSWSYLWSDGSAQSSLHVSQAGTYSLTASVVHNSTELCKSSDTVDVVFLQNSITNITDEICGNSDYNNFGFNIPSAVFTNNTSHSAVRNLMNAVGCDSIVNLHLNIKPTKKTEIHKNACQQYEWLGEILTASGDYTKGYQAENGCDSTVTLHLSIGYPGEEDVELTVCGEYVWAGETLTESGDYEKTFASSHECDSLVKLHLTIIDTFLRLTSTNPDFCETWETTLVLDGNFDDYLWNTGETAMTLDVTSGGRYLVTASNSVCEKTLFIDIPYCELNILTPNALNSGSANGYNNTLHIPEYITNQISDFSIEIYNRYGTLVFRSEDKNFVWDGKVNGKIFPGTTYSYIIRCTNMSGRPHLKKGTITVL